MKLDCVGLHELGWAGQARAGQCWVGLGWPGQGLEEFPQCLEEAFLQKKTNAFVMMCLFNKAVLETIRNSHVKKLSGHYYIFPSISGIAALSLSSIWKTEGERQRQK